MAKTEPVKLPKPPQELKDLAKFLEARGYSLAFPFDNVRQPGYIGSFNERGQEVVIDEGQCLRAVRKAEPGKVALGNYAKASTFSWTSFFKFFGGIVGVDLGGVKAKNVSLSFPKSLLQTRYITQLDLEEYISEKISSTCKKKVTDRANFVILQVLETDSIQYDVKLKRKLDAKGQADLQKLLLQGAAKAEVKAAVEWQSDTAFNLVLKDVTLTVGYKTAKALSVPVVADLQKIAVLTLQPEELRTFRKEFVG